MCSLRDAASDLESLKVKILALSLDDVRSQKAFAEAQELTYPLLSDPDGSVAARYGVLGRGIAQRVTFVVDPAGAVRLVDREVNVLEHGADLARKIRDLQKD